MTLDQIEELIAKKKAEFGGDMELTTLEYAGGDDKPCDIVDLVFDEETGTLRVKTVYRR